MSKQLIPIDEILFVFESWTLMMRSSLSLLLDPGSEVFLFNSSKKKIGRAKLNRFLPSRNPDINPIEITIIEESNNLKEVKFIMKIN